MLAVEGLEKSFSAKGDVVRAVDDVTFDVADGELLVLLGPSGCGKTTVLRCIAGHETAQGGSIRLAGEPVFDAARGVDLPPERRRIGMVFQNYALWPHLTVQRNIEFPLRAQKMKAELAAGDAVQQAAGLVDCVPYLQRFPSELSGGQQQRVALARGLVAGPRFMLFDEPLSNLDALLRAQVRHDLHELHRTVGFSGIYVTHDQSEAFALGDRLAIMRAGRVEQIGTPQEIYGRPLTEYAANFVGLSNRLELEPGGAGAWTLRGGPGREVPVDAGGACDALTLRFRPHDVDLLPGTTTDYDGLVLEGRVADSVYEGRHYDVSVTAGSATLNVHVAAAEGARLGPGDPVRIGLRWHDGSWFGDGRRVEVAARAATASA
ncbi:ABC transporter ATP-binding protein [Pseudonocardia broussonetiae]|uniref:ABC transporter ATP-binding protein n=1 Tax=Pseudonocardia broussonetiae TaxID=2736640 RepID=A0A6M6JC30_9PSEU|nr:ABC transporter ATP-binding protein [Pseudonocardia broussonetiae]QJY44507.1 ABC transporter ATP-binding protein [Pseudonocardia broussonetiae]